MQLSFRRNKILFLCFKWKIVVSLLLLIHSFFPYTFLCYFHRSLLMLCDVSTLQYSPAVILYALVPNHRFCVTENRQRISIYYTLSRLCLFFIHLTTQLLVVRCVMRDREAKIKTPAMTEYTVT